MWNGAKSGKEFRVTHMPIEDGKDSPRPLQYFTPIRDDSRRRTSWPEFGYKSQTSHY
jgi:hypothetical protein